MGAQEADGLEAEAEGPDFEDVDDAAASINDFETEGGEEENGPADAASKRQKHEQAGKDGETARAHEITRANVRQLEDGVAVQVLCAQDGESAGTWLEAKALRVESAGVVVKCVYPCVPSWEAASLVCHGAQGRQALLCGLLLCIACIDLFLPSSATLSGCELSLFSVRPCTRVQVLSAAGLGQRGRGALRPRRAGPRHTTA